MAELFSEDGPSSPPYLFGNLDEGEELHRDEGEKFGIRYLSLAHRQLGRQMDPFTVEYTPASPRDFMCHDSEEFFVLLEGELIYFICDDTTKKVLKTGDTIYLQANVPHRVELANKCQKAKGLIIYAEPK